MNFQRHQVIVKLPESENLPVNKSIFNVRSRYSNLEFLEFNEDSIVVTAKDSKNDRIVNIRKTHLGSVLKSRELYQDLCLLMDIQHKNIAKLLDVFCTDNDEVPEVYLVMEHVPTKLDLLNQNHKEFDHLMISSIVYQMLMAIRYLNSSGVIHGNLSPSLFHLNDQGLVKLMKLHSIAFKPDVKLTSIVKCDRYKAPEQLLGLESTDKIDLWSIGCILAELLTGKAFFSRKSYNSADQVKNILEVLGSPNERFIDGAPRFVGKFLKSLPRFEGVTFETLFDKLDNDTDSENDSLARDLLSHILKIDPSERIALDDAIRHPYFQAHFKEEIIAVSQFHHHEDVENFNELKTLIIEKVQQFHK